MRYVKEIYNDYILSVGTCNNGDIEITESEYNEILNTIQNKPQETQTIGYRLKSDLTWEQYEKEPDEEESIGGGL